MAGQDALDRREIYRFLGYQPDRHILTPQLEALVDRCMAQVRETAVPRTVFSPLLPLRRTNGSLSAASLPLPGRDMERHLDHCSQVVLLAVTLGTGLDALIRRTEAMDMAQAVVLDAAASAAVESAAQQAEEALRETLAAQGLYLTGRFSPGYGDFPLAVQHELLRLTDAGRKIGLTATPNHIMTPRKSITAVLGIADIPVRGHLAGCGTCVLRTTCLFRKRGTTCAVSDP